MKKSTEEKLVGQIDRLKLKQHGDNLLIERMMFNNSKISQKTDPETRKKYMEACDLIERISKCVERRSRLLKEKSQKLCEPRTMNLMI